MSVRKVKAAMAAARAAKGLRDAAEGAAKKVRAAAGLPPEEGQRIDPAMAKETDDPAANVKQGLGLLWKAAKKVAKDVKKDVTVSTVSHTIEDAGREIARAATSVAEKMGEGLEKIRPKDPSWAEPDDERMKPPYERDPQAGGGEGKPAAKPKGPTRSDPGFRIAIDDDDDAKK